MKKLLIVLSGVVAMATWMFVFMSVVRFFIQK
jgi:hypothetical protein